MTLKLYYLEVLSNISKLISGMRFTRLTFSAHPIKAVSLMLEKKRQRRQLAQLTPAQLNDIGITQEQLAIETNKHFWE